ncbi:MAG: molecular chaperone TorD family protein [Haloferacaceae archaeon]
MTTHPAGEGSEESGTDPETGREQVRPDARSQRGRPDAWSGPDRPDAWSGPDRPDAPGDIEMARGRSRVYGLLAATFDGDVETLATAIEEGAFLGLADVLPVTLDTGDLEGREADPDALSVGYDNLFLVPGPRYVPPFASAHAADPSEDFDSDSLYHAGADAGELLGDPAADLARLYDAANFRPERGDGIPDHLAAAFEFMAALCEREAELSGGASTDRRALEAIRGLQRRTLDRLGWLDGFEAAVATEDSVEGVFATLARIARTFAAWDAREGVVVDDE